MIRITFILSCFLAIVRGNAQVVINEVCAANADVNYDSEFFNFSPWIELYNTGNASVSLAGYFLSDDAFQPTKWAIPSGVSIPAKGYLLIWCDGRNSGLHTSFSLDSEGEQVVLTSPSNQLLDQIIFSKQYTNVSFGRKSDGGSTWSYLSVPSPASKNESPTGEVALAIPIASQKSGRYASSMSLVLSHPTPAAEIRYTLDGSAPGQNSTLYSTPIQITQTTTLKARAFKAGFIPGETLVETYFINERPFTLPVISISTKPDYLWNNTIGIYTNGTNGIPGNCNGNPVNWNQDWDRHASVSFFDAEGKLNHSQFVDIRIGGGCSRNNPQKSFIVKARDKYGNNMLEERLFSEKPHDRFGGFTMRNSGNDFNVTMFRDALMQELTRTQMKGAYLAYKPTVFYLNGQYWGIQNLREKIDADYIETNYGINRNDLDLLESWGNPIEGTNDAYVAYLNTLQTLNPLLPSTFQFIDQNIEVQEYINYLVAQIYFGNTDWPGNNIKYWRKRSGGKFRWLLFDMDFGFALYNSFNHPTLAFATDPNSGVVWPNPPWSTLHIRLVMQNPQFRTRFIQTLAAAMGSGFSPKHVTETIDLFAQRIANEIPFHKQRWGGNINDWNYEVQRLRNFATDRHQYMLQHITQFFNLTGDVKISTGTFPEGTGKIELNGVTLHEPLQTATYYRDLPFEVKPIPAPGYTFKNWKLIKSNVSVTSLIANGTAWKYFDNGSMPAPDWNALAYNDASWASGVAQLGYGEGDEQTVVSFGSNSNNKHITTYFRKNFTATNVGEIAALNASILFDDGIVVYLNGTEVYRNNMPTGTIENNTLALGAIAAENVFVDFSISKNLLMEGTNVIAVEVHQNSPQSSDLSFDFSLVAATEQGSEEIISTDATLTGIADKYVTIEAYFEEATPVTGLIINEVAASGSTAVDEFGEAEDWIEIYNSSSQPVDLGGLFITDNLQSKLKHQIVPGSETIINPGEYKLIWADNQTGQSALHTNFRLSQSGEQAGLYQMVGSALLVIDEISFDAHTKNTSASRIPDLTGPFVLTATPTPRTQNIFETVTSTHEEALYSVYPNPVTDQLIIKIPKPVHVKVTNMQGSTVLTTYLLTTHSISFSSLPTGLYVVSFITDEGILARRVIKR
ncbi:MAG: T9SS C-terminal target domain-containing protein [Bacteroidetes bacterium CHB5]|nr:T9SS C-terminal target domain-containing protein [Bacteroidetes bacterium CHB5]